MSEVLFYHLTETPLEAALPPLLARSLERDWKVCILGTDRDRLDRLDRHFWTYDDQSFLPHGLSGGPHDARQPVLLTDRLDPAIAADVLMLVDGARSAPDVLKQHTRACVFFDGNDPDQTADARTYWTEIKSSGIETRYWAQEQGRWVQKA